MKKLFFALAVLTASALITTSCSDDNTAEEVKIPVSGVTVTPSTGGVVVGTTLTLKAEILPENATVKEIKWLSRDAKVATVDPKSGVVTGVAVGEVDIMALCDGKNGKAHITVTAAPIRVASVELSKTTLALFVGKSEVLTATVKPDDATNKIVVWTSSNPAIATVAENGSVSAVGEGTATITATADEKSATCEVTTTLPAITDIKTPYLKDIAGNTIQMTAPGFKAGDKVLIEAIAGDAYTAEATVANVTVTAASFDLPAAAPRDRSYMLTIMRGAEKLCEAYLRPDDQIVKLYYELGYFLIDSHKDVADDPNISKSELGAPAHRGYVPGKIFTFDVTTKEFTVWKADAKLITPTTGDNFDFTFATGVTTIDPLRDLFIFGDVKTVWAADSHLVTLDMTLFPNATDLLGWGPVGTPGALNKIESVNFGSYTDDAHACKLKHIQLERQSLKGTIDFRNCIHLINLVIDNNKIEKLELGSAAGITEKDKDRMLIFTNIVATNNKLKEIDISNCGRLRKLLLAGNKIERANLVNNALGDGANSARPDVWFPYLYILKNMEDFSIDWATAAEAEGRTRHIDVEHYWWRTLSDSNKKENKEKPSFNRWVNNNPIVKALKDGFTVTDYTYALEDGKGVHVVHKHTSIDDICVADDHE
ncbi:MAG: Ig-like domain-containing protein [Alistipes sp.]